MKKLAKKLTALMFAVMMIVTLVPATGLASRAASKKVSTKDFEEIKKLLEEDGNVSITLSGDVYKKYRDAPSTTIFKLGKGIKEIDLNGKELKCLVTYYEGYLNMDTPHYMFKIGEGSQLAISDSSGKNKGKLNFDAYMYSPTHSAIFFTATNYHNYSENHRNYFKVDGGRLTFNGGEICTRSKEQWLVDGCNVEHYNYDVEICRVHRFDGHVRQNTNTVGIEVNSGTVVINGGIIAARGYREMDTDEQGEGKSSHCKNYVRAACIEQHGGDVIVNNGCFRAYSDSELIQKYSGTMTIKAGTFASHANDKILIPTPDVVGNAGNMPLYMDGSPGQTGIPASALDPDTVEVKALTKLKGGMKWREPISLTITSYQKAFESGDFTEIKASDWNKIAKQTIAFLLIHPRQDTAMQIYNEKGEEITEINWDLTGNPLYYTPIRPHWESDIPSYYSAALSLSSQNSVMPTISMGGNKITQGGDAVNEIAKKNLNNTMGYYFTDDTGENVNAGIIPTQGRFYMKDIIPETAKPGDTYLLTYTLCETVYRETGDGIMAKSKKLIPVHIVEPSTELLKGEGVIDDEGVSGKMLTVSGDVNKYPASELKYQWQRKVDGTWTDISGATANSYTLTRLDDDKSVRAVITATDRSGSIITNECECADGLVISEANFEDPVFRQYLSDNFDTDKNGVLSDTEVEEIREIRLNNNAGDSKYKDVVSLKGITKLHAVTVVNADYTKVAKFDGWALDELTTLSFRGCPLDSLDTSYNRKLTKLDLAETTGYVKGIDTYGNPLLARLDLSGGSVTSVDISDNPILVKTLLDYNKVQSLTTANGKKYKRYSTGNNMISIDSDMADSDIVIAWYSKNMPHIGNILKNKTNVNDSDDRLTWAEAKAVKKLTINTTYNPYLFNIKGVEYFPNLETLTVCKAPNLCQVDLSMNRELRTVSFAEDGLTELDLSNNQYIETLNVRDNKLTNLDLSSDWSLENLNADGNALTSLYLSQNELLKSLSVRGNKLSDLDLTGLSELREVKAYANDMGLIRIAGCTELEKALAGTVTYPADGEFGWEYESHVNDENMLLVDCNIAIVRDAAKAEITLHPESTTAAVGKTATFAVAAEGSGLTYQWIYSSDGGNKWKVITGATDTELTVTATEDINNYRYRCRVINAAGKVVSEAATLTVSGVKPLILTQPVSQKVARAKKATFTVAVAGNNIRLQWYQSKDNGKTWTALAGETGTALTVKGSVANNGFLYRCKAANSKGKSFSTEAKLTVSGVKPAIRTQPVNKAVTAGKQVTFKIDATGVGMKYQWQYSKDGGKTWINNKGKGSNTNTFSFTTKKTQNGLKYRCVVTNTYGSRASNAVNLKVK